MKELNNILNEINNEREPNSIELLGFAKNNIVDVKNSEKELPTYLSEKLSQAYALLDEVEEYLYDCK